jgi:hypothetical protein
MGTPEFRQAAWFLDPSGRHEYRFWDGSTWTGHVSDLGKAGIDASMSLAPTVVAPRKRPRWPWVLGAVLVVGVVGCIAALDQPTAAWFVKQVRIYWLVTGILVFALRGSIRRWKSSHPAKSFGRGPLATRSIDLRSR